MEVEENLFTFRISWKGENDKSKASLKTEEAIADWFENEALEIEKKSCGTSNNGEPIDLILKSNYSNNKVGKRLFLHNTCKLIKSFRENEEISQVYLSYNDTTEDIFYKDEKTFEYFNKKVYKKGEFVLIHENNKPLKENK